MGDTDVADIFLDAVEQPPSAIVATIIVVNGFRIFIFIDDG